MMLPERVSKHTPILGEQGIKTIRRTKLAIVGMSVMARRLLSWQH
jgi:hypothetical protein